MAQEKILSDYSGGMNALAAVDKLDPKECLLAENVRFDETGNVQSAGAFTHQNTSPYAAVAGTGTSQVHSLYWNPSLGGVAGVGQDVFIGKTLGGMADTLKGQNPGLQRMSFGNASGRVYFDVGSVGYWTDMTNLLAVDWPPPSSVSALAGPTVVGQGIQTGTGGTWASPQNIGSTNSAVVTVINFNTATSRALQATMGTNSYSVSTSSAVTGVGFTVVTGGVVGGGGITLQATLLKAGIPVGTPQVQSVPANAGAGILNTMTFGGNTAMWGSTIVASDVNNAGFGFQLVAIGNSGSLAAFFDLATLVYGGATTGMVAGTGTTGTLTGTYSWVVTFVSTFSGEESGASPDTVGVVLSAQQGTLTSIPTGDARTNARNIYRKGNLLTAHYLVGTINDNISTTYSDNVTDIAALTEGVILAGDVPGDYPNSRLGGTNVRFPCLNYDRVFWVTPNTPNQIIWSKPLNGFAYPAINQLFVGDSHPIVGLVSIFGELIIIKTDSIWRLTGTDETSFDLSQTPSSIGTDQPFTIDALPDKIIFANRWGLWVFNGYTAQPLTTKLDLWFKQQDRTGKSIFGVNGFHPPEITNSAATQNFYAIGNAEKFYFAYAEAGQTLNNAMLCFDVKHSNITKREPGSPLPLSLTIDPVSGFVYMGDATGYVSLLDDWNGATGGGSALNFDFQYQYIDLQRGSNKSLWALEFFINTNGQPVTPYVYYDGGENFEALSPITTTSLQRVLRTLESANSRKMQNFSYRLNATLNPVNISGTPQIELVHVKPYFDIRTGRARTGQ